MGLWTSLYSWLFCDKASRNSDALLWAWRFRSFTYDVREPVERFGCTKRSAFVAEFVLCDLV